MVPYAILLALIALTLSVLVLAAVPPVSRDALTHHLFIPKLYLAHGGIYEIPYVKYSYYPMNLDLLYIIPMAFGNDIVPKYIHFAFGIATAFLIYRYGKSRLNSVYGGLGALFFLSIPVAVKLSITAYVDLGLICFSFASLLYILEWCRKAFPVKYLFFSALCCGLALGTKYNALITFVLITLFIPVIYTRSASAPPVRIDAAIKPALFYVMIALIFFSPWMIRNYMWKKNPLYPLYHHISSTGEMNNGQEETRGIGSKSYTGNQFGSFAIRRIIYHEKWWQTAAIPVRVFFQGRDDDPKFFDGQLNPFLFILPFFAFWGYRDEASASIALEKKTMLAFAVLFLLLVFFAQDVRIRYIAPIIPPLVVLSMFGLHNIILRGRKETSLLKKAVCYLAAVTAVSWMGWINGKYVIGQFDHVKPLEYLTGQIDRDRYIEKYRSEYPMMVYANQNLPADVTILSVFLGNRYYYSERKIVSNFSTLADAARQSKTPDALLSELKQRGYTHIMIGYSLFNSWAGANFTDRQKHCLSTFFSRKVRLLFSKNGYGLYQL